MADGAQITSNAEIPDGLFEMLSETHRSHGNETRHYRFLKGLCERVFHGSVLTRSDPVPMLFGPFGMLTLPYHKMGAIDSIDLFGVDELIIFSFYWANRGAYKRAVDIGANLGLHTILMSRSGYEVTAFEPDPVHFKLLKQNLAYNGVEQTTLVEAAVSDHRGEAEFVRVKGNTTGSHLSGAKASPYGELDRFSVELVPFEEAVKTADLVKVDAEGHEVVILRSLPPERWNSLDAIVEVGTPENAAALLEHFKPLPVRLFSQKTGWSLVRDYAHLPTSHREGSLFITAKAEMPWPVLR